MTTDSIILNISMVSSMKDYSELISRLEVWRDSVPYTDEERDIIDDVLIQIKNEQEWD